jgi:hypothetical protein
MNRTFVLIRHNDGRIEAWRDYGNVAWGSPIYTVLGYFTGTHRQAIAYAKRTADAPLETCFHCGDDAPDYHSIEGESLCESCHFDEVEQYHKTYC